MSSAAVAEHIHALGTSPLTPTPSPSPCPSPSSAVYREWKVVQRPGAFAYPVFRGSEVVNRLALFTPEKIKRYNKTVNAMLADGIYIPIIPEHDMAGVPLTRKDLEKRILAESVGSIKGSRLNAHGELELLHEVTDPVWVPKMGTTVLDCSPGFRDWYRTGDGKKWTDVVAHVALTHHPVDHHKPKFVPATTTVEPTKSLTKPKAAGVCVLAGDSGRVLMLQRAVSSNDPASGTWEFPGGHIEQGEQSFDAAKREWSEETGLKLPRKGKLTGTWKSTNGVYEGFVWTIPAESDLDINLYHEDRKVRNPDDPDGDNVETLAWWDVDHLPGSTAVRKELQDALPLVFSALRLPSSKFSVTYMSLTAATGPAAPQLVPLWEVPFSTALSCLAPAGTSFVFKHADGKQRFGSRPKAVSWLRTQYSRQFSIKMSGPDDVDSGIVWMAVMRAPIGGVNLQGKFYPGGQFIPNEVLDRATPEEKQKIHAAKEGYVAKRSAEAKTHIQDAESVHDAILRHAGEHGKAEQHPLDKRDTLRRWTAIKTEHGENGALERVVTLAAKEAKLLQAMGHDGLNSAMGKHYQRRLTAYAQMVGFAVNPDSVNDYKKGLKEALAGEGGKRSIQEAGSDSSKDNKSEATPIKSEELGAKSEESSDKDVSGAQPGSYPDAHAAIASAQHLSPVKKKAFSDAVKLVEQKLTPAAKERLAKHCKGFIFHSDIEDLTAELIEKSPEMKDKLKGKKAGGVYSKKTGELHLNGGERIDGKKVTPDAVYAHEYSHAIDGPEHELSKSADWKAAWKEEAQKVSRYATKTPQEGFAEFGRLVYAGGLGHDQLMERYPKMMAHWEGLGLLPSHEGKLEDSGNSGGSQPAAGNEPQMPDVFDEPFNTPDGIGDKALSRRGSGETLKDYLTGIGGVGAHETIRDYAKQLHDVAKQQVDEHNEIVRSAMSGLTSHYGKGFTKNHADLKKDDPAAINGLDTVASELAGSYPHVFGGDAGYGGDANDTASSGKAMEKLHDMLKEGIKASPELRDYEDQAVQEWHDNGRPMPEGYEPEQVGEADTSFDFGENAKEKPSAIAATSEEHTEDPHPFKSTPEEAKAAWEKFAAKAGASSSGLMLPVMGTKTKAEDMPQSGIVGESSDMSADEKFKAKMAAEERKYAKPAVAATPPAKAPKFGTETGKPLATADGHVVATKKPHETKPDEHTPLQVATEEKPKQKQPPADGFMQPAPGQRYSADDIEGLAGQSFTNDKGLAATLSKDEDGTWSVGKEYGLSSQGAANLLNEMKADKARGLFGDEVTAQKPAEKKIEKLEWAAPAKPKETPSELPGMKDTFAPGMFGKAKTESEVGNDGKSAIQSMSDQIGKENSLKKKLSVAMKAMNGKSPSAQRELLDHIRANNTDVYMHAMSNYKEIPEGLRAVFNEHSAKTFSFMV